MNALKTALTSLLKGDATLRALFPSDALVSGAIQVYDKMAPQSTQAASQKYPYVIMQVQAARPDYHMAGRSAETFNVMLKAIDTGESSKRGGQIDERIEELLHPNEPITVPGWRTGFQGRTAQVDMTELSSGVKYQHVGGVYRITLIPIS